MIKFIRPRWHKVTLETPVVEQVKALEAARYAKEQEEAHREAMAEKAHRREAHHQCAPFHAWRGDIASPNFGMQSCRYDQHSEKH